MILFNKMLLIIFSVFFLFVEPVLALQEQCVPYDECGEWSACVRITLDPSAKTSTLNASTLPRLCSDIDYRKKQNGGAAIVYIPKTEDRPAYIKQTFCEVSRPAVFPITDKNLCPKQCSEVPSCPQGPISWK